MQETLETWVQSLGQEDPLEKEMATHCGILAWRIPWTEELGRLQSVGLQRVRHDWSDLAHSTGSWEGGVFWTLLGDTPHVLGVGSVLPGIPTVCPSWNLTNIFERFLFLSSFFDQKLPNWKLVSELVFLPAESPWTEEPGRLQSMGSQRVGHDWVTKHIHTHIHQSQRKMLFRPSPLSQNEPKYLEGKKSFQKQAALSLEYKCFFFFFFFFVVDLFVSGSWPSLVQVLVYTGLIDYSTLVVT